MRRRPWYCSTGSTAVIPEQRPCKWPFAVPVSDVHIFPSRSGVTNATESLQSALQRNEIITLIAGDMPTPPTTLTGRREGAGGRKRKGCCCHACSMRPKNPRGIRLDFAPSFVRSCSHSKGASIHYVRTDGEGGQKIPKFAAKQQMNFARINPKNMSTSNMEKAPGFIMSS